MAEEELRMPFWSHLEELRKRIVHSLAWAGIGFVVCFNFSEDLLRLLLWPMNTKLSLVSSFPFFSVVANEAQQKLHYTALAEPFWAHLKIGLIAGIMIVFPMIMLQVWKFIAPGLLPRERRYVGFFVFFSSFFFTAGVLFCYVLLLPFAIPFLLQYKTEDLIAIIKIGEYIDFVLKFLLASGLVFELPLIIVLLTRMGVVNAESLGRYRKFAFLASFVFGAILTPTQDVFNLTLMSVPIYLLYEVGIVASRLFGRKKKKPESSEVART